MKKTLTKKEYDNFMRVVDGYIKKAERMIDNLPKCKKVRQLSFEDWAKWQNGELKIKING